MPVWVQWIPVRDTLSKLSGKQVTVNRNGSKLDADFNQLDCNVPQFKALWEPLEGIRLILILRKPSWRLFGG